MILSSIIVAIGVVSGTLGTYSSVAKIIRNYQ
jgi:vesicular inhibitory amino acid transporter